MARTRTRTIVDLEREHRKIRRLRSMVAMVSNLLRRSDMPILEAVHLVQAVRSQALRIFPGQEETYDRLYAPRFARILREKYNIPDPREDLAA